MNFIQADTGVNSETRHLHLENIDVANIICQIFALKSLHGGDSLIYDSVNLKTRMYDEYSQHPINEKILCTFINLFIVYNNKFKNKDFILTPLLFDLKDFVLNSSVEEKEIIKLMFKDLMLESLFDEISQTYFKDRLNLIITAL